MRVDLPKELQAEVDDLVRQGEFPDAPTAVVELVRAGLGYRYRRSPSPRLPAEPRELPGKPGRLPDDVNWADPDR
jgi:Arc/MetJ-type ribon-helix-helix transcriptional regulator